MGTCTVCRGYGHVENFVRTPLGILNSISPCRDCQGRGKMGNSCTCCDGDGRIRKEKIINMKVPAGVKNGSRLKIKGEGNTGRKGGQPGDLFVFISVANDKILSRERANILSTISIPYHDALLGTSLSVLTVDGIVDLYIPP